VPTRRVVRALTVAVGVLLALTATSVARIKAQPPSQSRAETQVQGAGVARGQTRRQLEARAAQLERRSGRVSATAISRSATPSF
jgi:hypothetical protein